MQLKAREELSYSSLLEGKRREDDDMELLREMKMEQKDRRGAGK